MNDMEQLNYVDDIEDESIDELIERAKKNYEFEKTLKEEVFFLDETNKITSEENAIKMIIRKTTQDGQLFSETIVKKIENNNSKIDNKGRIQQKNVKYK